MKRSLALAGLLGLALSATACEEEATVPTTPVESTALLKKNKDTFITDKAAKLDLLVSGDLTPIANAGETMPGGEVLVGIPDGLGAFGGRYLNLFMNHEISSSAGFSRVSKFLIDTDTREIVEHEYVVDASDGYSRLCSAEWMDARDGFPGGAFFTGEEDGAGVQLAIDRQGNVTEMPWLGYYAHENQISVPGFRSSVVLVNFDDDGTSGSSPDPDPDNGSESELYMYVSSNANGALRGTGQLYVFNSPDALNVGELTVGQTIVGEWTPVPESVALDPNGTQDWIDLNPHFSFARLEDGFIDRLADRDEPAIYFYDTGDDDLTNSSGAFWDDWGSIYRLSWADPQNPAGTAYLTLVERSSGPANGWASPDNGDMNEDGVVMLQEDPANGPWEPAAGVRPPAIFMFQALPGGGLMNTAGVKIAEVNGGDCSPGADPCWETSGIIDASEWFGPDAWLLDVQAHDTNDDTGDCPECVEDGQLLLMELD
ncbi:MAG: PhoX family protein [marine benthic group bacterium]|nr:PhoX family protein [Gemmatimonadota bacterium]